MSVMGSAGIAHNVIQENLFEMEGFFQIQNHSAKVVDFTALLGSPVSCHGGNARRRGRQTHCN